MLSVQIITLLKNCRKDGNIYRFFIIFVDFLLFIWYDSFINVLCSKLFVTESYFCRFFKKSTGMTLAKYITEVRLKKAQLLLENTSDGISTIALNVGFDDANYFARTFRNTTGITPTQYRKKQVKV